MTTPSKTTTALAPTKPSAINLMASRMQVEPTKLFDTLKNTVFAKATDHELLALVVVSNEYNLNPFLKEIYAFPAKGGGIVPIVSVDGWNKMLVNKPDFDGIEFDFTDDEAGNPVSCTATVHVKSRSHPVKVTEYLAECKRNTEPWNNMPRRMLRNRTLCQAARMAFGFTGIQDEDSGAIEVESVVMQATPQAAPPKLIPAKPGETPQVELEAVVVTAGFTFDLFQKWGEETGNVEGASSMASFAEIPTDVARRILRNKNGLLTSLEQGKGAN